MFYKGLILDLDNTLYNYNKCHESGLVCVFSYINIIVSGQKNKTVDVNYDIRKVYENISYSLKKELNNTASCHNKAIYFKQLLEELHLSVTVLDTINDMYWNTFLDNMVCFDGVKDFIIWNRRCGIKIGILTDYETEYQIKKLNKLNLTDLIDIVVTSEEVGIEKPSIKMFQTILRKLELSSYEVIVIGDSYEKDINGAINANIYCWWYTARGCIESDINEGVTMFDNWAKLLSDFKDVHNELCNLKQMSRFVGERFDLVQAGGGNSSVKMGDWMFIKASGINMSQIDTRTGYVVVNNNKLRFDILNKSTHDVTYYNIFGKKRASIETFMHSILKKYTLHIHPIQVNRILITQDAYEIVSNMFPDALIIDYLTPGIKICDEIRDKYQDESIIFLINHGIIITSDNYDEIYDILNIVITKFENMGPKLHRYKYTNKITCYIHKTYGIESVSYLCENNTIMSYLEKKASLFTEKITFPDALIYCGVSILFMNNFEDINEYYNKYNETPRIIITDNSIYINSHSLNKCKEIEEVLLSNLIILDSNLDKNYLCHEEICFLNNWDAEKYRKLL